jgi:hypothetical protein
LVIGDPLCQKMRELLQEQVSLLASLKKPCRQILEK